ncbi:MULTISPECIES: PIG-L deacetylase family protein [unclassified Pseudomonas]|uniref:PIG-L deacetylase family protein n=1 Tax=unclassified Pseudomonas TaxID=196821 RepID=UPI0008719BF8|nr:MULTISPECIES: PIG-L family deacetylase [unclassified Pseudomonas]SCW54497.1 N-acetylglucosaminyl deacetylase, LmbE family [Pseudomonas sp. NFACC05-1]SFL49951.1 N-acetylglucosaminyl deacetylase, LmbE family [Pseudomonas sp. NFACC46-3]
MSGRKQQLLKRHRQRKRLILIGMLLVASALGFFVSWWASPLFLLLGWVAHEAWFCDHLFYAPDDDYRYDFPAGTLQFSAILNDGLLQVAGAFSAGQTLILQVRVKSHWLGRFFDPQVWIGDDRQDLERGAAGERFLNLSGQDSLLASGALRVHGRFCSLASQATLHVLSNPDFGQQRLLIIAPHADDAELAAFGLYSRASDVAIVTLTQGEIEADNYRDMGLDMAQAARLKGRLRSWDSLAVPLWGGVGQQQCVQLGYYCLQLGAMAQQPERSFGSLESGDSDTRDVRRFNALSLPGDVDGQPSWRNLVADLVGLLEHHRPDAVVTPHPELDPHSDHVAATRALMEAIELSTWRPRTLLLYANHLHDNDRWPMGPAGYGIALPPAIEPLPADGLWSPLLDAPTRMDKAMALGMQHDLQGRPPFKRQLRRMIQRLLAGRRWPRTGEDEFFRKAVRRHELFWTRPLDVSPKDD